MITLRQLALPFPHAPRYEEEVFCAAPSNDAALSWLDRTASWPDGRLALWGQPGSGKTHLLHLWCRRNGAAVIEGSFLRGLPILPARGIALDDADAVAEETALLHLLNAARELRLPVLLAGRTPPARWSVRLPDLASRLRTITSAQLLAAEDDLLRTLLARLLADRQLVVSEQVQTWLLLHLPRHPSALREVAARLDRASLAAGGRVSRNLAAAVVAEMQADSDDVFASSPTAVSHPGPALI